MLHQKKYGKISSIVNHRDENNIMYKSLKVKVLAKDKWQRALLMVIFFIIKHIVLLLVNLIALFQFFHNLCLDHPNGKLLELSQGLNNYLLQILNFLTFNSQNKPFPFVDDPN